MKRVWCAIIYYNDFNLTFDSKLIYIYYILYVILSEGDNIAAIQRHGTSSGASCVLTINTVFPMIVVLQRIIKFVWTE